MSFDSLTRSSVTHTLMVLGQESSLRLLFVNERSGATTSYIAVPDDRGLRLEEQPFGRAVRIGYDAGRSAHLGDGVPTVSLEEVTKDARYHLYRDGDVWAIDRLGDVGLLLQSCRSSDEAAVRKSEQGELGAAHVYDVWLSPSTPYDVAKSALDAVAESMATLMAPCLAS